jgi:uncharacterized protein DUF4193
MPLDGRGAAIYSRAPSGKKRGGGPVGAVSGSPARRSPDTPDAIPAEAPASEPPVSIMSDDDLEEDEDLDEEELDEDSLEEGDFEEDDDEDDDAEFVEDDELEGEGDAGTTADDEDEDAAATAKKSDETSEDDDDIVDLDEELHPDDVEEALDVVLRERTAKVGLEDEEEEEDEPDDRGEGGNRIVPRRENEFLCKSCFLVLPRHQLADEERMLCRDCA